LTRADPHKPLPDEYDPPKAERKYFRDETTGDMGWIVQRGGKPFFHYDREAETIERPFRKHQHVEDKKHRPMSRYQLAQIAHVADKRLCHSLGKHVPAKSDWLNLTDEQRTMWAQTGPTKNYWRHELWEAIMGALAPLARKE